MTGTTEGATGGGGPMGSADLGCCCLLAFLEVGGGGGAMRASGIGSGDIDSDELSLSELAIPDPRRVESLCGDMFVCVCWTIPRASSVVCERVEDVFFFCGFIHGDSRTTRAGLRLVTKDFLLPEAEASFLLIRGDSEVSIGEVALGVVAFAVDVGI